MGHVFQALPNAAVRWDRLPKSILSRSHSLNREVRGRYYPEVTALMMRFKSAFHGWNANILINRPHVTSPKYILNCAKHLFLKLNLYLVFLL